MRSVTVRLVAIVVSCGAAFPLFAGESVTITLEPDADTWIAFGKFDPPGNHGTEPFLELGRFSIFSDTFILIRFDLSGVPNDAVVTSATLRMFEGTTPYNTGDTWSLTQISDAWDENTVDEGSVPDASGLSTEAPSAANPVIDVTGLVIDWVDNGTPNHGLLIDNFGFNDGGNFQSREGPDAPPELEISYLLPPSSCDEDLDDDNEVGASDLAALLAAWGTCDACPADIDDDGEVGPSDLALLLAAWGPCSE